MNHFKLSLISLVILFAGCGGSSSSSTPDAASENTSEAKTVTEAEKNLNALAKFASLDLSLDTDNSTKTLRKAINSKLGSQKTATKDCTDGGTLTGTSSEDEKTLTYSFNNCQEGTTFINGEMVRIQPDSDNFEIKYNALTIKDTAGTQYMNLTLKVSLDSNSVYTSSINGVVKQTFTSGEVNNLTFTNFVTTDKETSDESWYTINGTVALESKCTTGTYTFETIEKLVESTDGSENTESGILKLNGATYTFENPHVTIQAGSESETITQSELGKRMSAHNACDI